MFRPTRCGLDLQWEEGRKEGARLAREMHDTLFQRISQCPDVARRGGKTNACGFAPSKILLRRALYPFDRAIEEGRAALQGLRRVDTGSTSFLQALSAIQDQLMLATCTQIRILVTGKPKSLESAIHKQILATVREGSKLGDGTEVELFVPVDGVGDVQCETTTDRIMRRHDSGHGTCALA